MIVMVYFPAADESDAFAADGGESKPRCLGCDLFWRLVGQSPLLCGGPVRTGAAFLCRCVERAHCHRQPTLLAFGRSNRAVGAAGRLGGSAVPMGSGWSALANTEDRAQARLPRRCNLCRGCNVPLSFISNQSRESGNARDSRQRTQFRTMQSRSCFGYEISDLCAICFLSQCRPEGWHDRLVEYPRICGQLLVEDYVGVRKHGSVLVNIGFDHPFHHVIQEFLLLANDGQSCHVPW